MVECKTENLKEANLDRYVSLLQDIDSQPENDPSNPGIGPLRPQKSCESNSEKLAKRKHPWIRNYGLRNTLTSLEKSPERSPEKSHGGFKPIENQSEEKAIKVEVTDDLGAKYLAFFSSCSLKMRETYSICFAQLVYFLREVCYFRGHFILRKGVLRLF